MYVLRYMYKEKYGCKFEYPTGAHGARTTGEPMCLCDDIA